MTRNASAKWISAFIYIWKHNSPWFIEYWPKIDCWRSKSWDSANWFVFSEYKSICFSLKSVRSIEQCSAVAGRGYVQCLLRCFLGFYRTSQFDGTSFTVQFKPILHSHVNLISQSHNNYGLFKKGIDCYQWFCEENIERDFIRIIEYTLFIFL